MPPRPARVEENASPCMECLTTQVPQANPLHVTRRTAELAHIPDQKLECLAGLADQFRLQFREARLKAGYAFAASHQKRDRRLLASLPLIGFNGCKHDGARTSGDRCHQSDLFQSRILRLACRLFGNKSES